ncbi:MAG TPA: hypothetical protein VK979_05330 [Guyparkeria sp.]|nr:hypothetical protein [Guyparkeria sp.]
MSRYDIKVDHPEIENAWFLTVGWDDELETFFFHLDSNNPAPTLMYGTTHRELFSVEELEYVVREHTVGGREAMFGPEIRSQLISDQENWIQRNFQPYVQPEVFSYRDARASYPVELGQVPYAHCYVPEEETA